MGWLDKYGDNIPKAQPGVTVEDRKKIAAYAKLNEQAYNKRTAEQAGEEYTSPIIQQIQKAQQDQQEHSDIIYDGYGKVAKIEGKGINPTVGPIDAAVALVAAGAVGGVEMIGQLANLANPLPINPFKNAYKLNPWAFKPNPEAYYRGIGRSGVDDALETGMLRTANKTGNYGEDLYMTNDFNVAKGMYSHDQSTFKGNPFGEADDYWEEFLPKDSKSYIAEIPHSALTSPKWQGSEVLINQGALPIDNIKFLKEHWLQGYKEVAKPEFADLYRVQPKDFNPLSTIQRIKQKQLNGEELNWMEDQILHDPEKYAQFSSRGQFHGGWYEKDPNRLDYYLQDKFDEAPEILQARVPKNQVNQYSVKNIPEAQKTSLSPETEFILPEDIRKNAIRHDISKWEELKKNYKPFAYGGTIQPNYNDSKVTLPEGFVGMGNDTTGRNYSPAWGGAFRNGGEIMNVASIENPIAQNGKVVSVKDNLGRVRNLNTNSDEYSYLYRTNQLANYDDKLNTYTAISLAGPTVTAQRTQPTGFLNEWGRNIAEESKDAGLLNTMIGVPINAALSMPQMAATKLFSGEAQRPSEALGIENTWGKLATDIVLDPLNLVGAGLFNKGKKVSEITKALPSVMEVVESNAQKVVQQAEPWKLIEPTTNTLQIKSTMLGSPLEKQLGKTGEININSLKAHIGKADVGQQDKFILNKVIDEKFAGKNKIDYNELREAVSDELIPLNAKLTDEYANYGIGRLGYPQARRKTYETTIKNIESDIDSYKKSIASNPGKTEQDLKVLKADEQALKDLDWKLITQKHAIKDTPLENTSITFSNELGFGRGNTSHYTNEGTLGHSRVLVSNEEPDIMHILESQSDFYQKGGLKGTKWQAEQSLAYMEDLAKQQKELYDNAVQNPLNEDWKLPNGNIMTNYAYREGREGQKTANALKRAEVNSWEQKELLGKNHQERFLQENVKYAAEQGKSKLRYPTSETAVKIEGYTPKYKFDANLLDEQAQLKMKEFDQKLSDIGTEDFHLDISELSQRKNRLGTHMDIYYSMPKKDNFQETLEEVSKKYGQEAKNEYREFNELEQEFIKKKQDIINKKIQLRNERQDYESILQNDPRFQKPFYEDSHQTILKKYEDAPKMIKKTLGVDTKTVIDPKGNTWYEFDIPKKFREGKAEIKALSTLPIGIGASQLLNQTEEQPSFASGGVIKDNNGYWNPDNWGKPVQIDSNEITMQGVYEPLLGVGLDAKGRPTEKKLMKPNGRYHFNSKSVLEVPIALNGISQQNDKNAAQLEQLQNFTNYNNPSKNWLNKYE